MFNVTKCSQFGDIYQEDYFMNIMKDEINIVKELPPHLKSLDIEGIGSQVYHPTFNVFDQTKYTNFYNNVYICFAS